MAKTKAHEDFLLVDELDVLDKLKRAGVEITATAAELNALDGITATVAELNKLDGVTSTPAELNLVDNQVASVTIVLDAEGTQGANIIQAACQFKDAAGADMAIPVAVPWYLADDAAGLDPATVAHSGGAAIGTDGALIESIANLSGLAISEADGDLDINFTEAGALTKYLVFVLPNGKLTVSAAITHS